MKLTRLLLLSFAIKALVLVAVVVVRVVDAVALL